LGIPLRSVCAISEFATASGSLGNTAAAELSKSSMLDFSEKLRIRIRMEWAVSVTFARLSLRQTYPETLCIIDRQANYHAESTLS
jgi:hypothetical protein